MSNRSVKPLIQEEDTAREPKNPDAFEKMTKAMDGFNLD